MKKIFGIFILLVISWNTNAQNLTNEGTDFWVGFTEVYDETAAIFEINISARQPTTGTVTIIGGSGFTTPFSVVPGVVTTITIPPADAHNPFSETIIDRAIHVESIEPITVYASTFHLYRSEASVCLPSPSLGSDYMITTYPNRTAPSGPFESEFVVVCGPDPIQVEIVPSCPTAAGGAPGDPIIVDMVPGDMYQVQADGTSDYDLSGTTVTATNGTDKFAVFNGHKWTHLQVGSCTSTTADPLYEIAYPTPSWGYEYIALLTEDQSDNVYRVTALADGCDIYEDATYITTINEGEVYDGQLTAECTYITTSEQAAITQSMITGGCSGTATGDPSMVMLNSNEQMYLDTVTFYAVEYNGLDTNYAAVITRTSDIGTITLNDDPLIGFTPVPYDGTYSYKIFGIDTGSHTLATTGCGFLAYTYGLQWAESYFYAAGVRVNAIDDSISFTSVGTSNPNQCDIDTVLFTPFTSGGTVVSYNWNFGDGGTSTEENPTHIYDSDGTFDVTLIIEYTCFTDTIVESLTLYSSPDHSSTFANSTCYNWDDGSIDITPTGGTPGYTYEWEPDGETTEDLTDLEPGTYSVTITDANGCISEETFTITEPDEIIVDVSPAGPFTPADGIQDLTATPPGGSWSADCGGCVDPVSGEFDPLDAGTGVWTVCYSAGTVPCDIEECITIIVDTACALASYGSDPTCFGYSDGSVTVNVSGGVGPITFVITDEDGDVVNVGNSNTANSLSEGWYYFDIDDDICSFYDSIYIDAPDQMEIELDIQDPLCNGDLTGYVEVDTVLNPTGDYDGITYIWSDGTNGIELDTMVNAGAGDYTLSITDENGCPASIEFTIEEPPALEFVEIGYVPALCRLYPYQSGSGQVYAAAAGGTPDYTYLWENVYELTTSENTTWGGLNPGLYEMTVTDNNGCTLVQQIQLDSLTPQSEFSMTSPGFTSQWEGTAELCVEFVNQSQYFSNVEDPFADTSGWWNLNTPQDPTSVPWLYYEGTEGFNQVLDTCYNDGGEYDVCLIIQNKNGCVDTTCKTILVHDKPILITPNIFTPGHDGVNSTFFFPHVALEEFECTIVNRWGITVAHLQSINDSWDGTDRSGSECADGVYFYIYNGTATNGTRFEGQGTVQLLRDK
ncbi:MAG: PKD domain-containing protein [Flavobacteriales bacterium]|nr:PKD domain-containing protein [Flavobacteriales bacterium]